MAMDFSKLELLPQVRIDKPCSANWDQMDGDEQKRHCAGCGCRVHNIAEMSAQEAETLFASPDRVCARLTVDDQQSVLTRDGWIPRMLLAGAIAATVAGCTPKEVSITTPTTSVASTTMTTPSGPNPIELIEERIIDLYEEVVEAVFPSAKPTRMIAGIIAPTMGPPSSLPSSKP